MQVIVDNILTSYKKYGTGKKIILYLHGWGDSADSFEALAKLISKKYTSILLDLPGFGGSARPPSDWGVPEYAEFTGKFIRKIETEPYAVIGHSNGGAISIFATGSKILKPRKLALIASSGVRGGASSKKIFYKALAKIAKFFILIFQKNIQAKIKRKLYGKIGSDYMVVEDMQENFKKVVSYDVLAIAGKIKIPTILIYGEDDNTTPINQARKIAGCIGGSKLEIINQSGHFPHKDQTESVGKIVEDFLR